jgi:hypothetical protein
MRISQSGDYHPSNQRPVFQGSKHMDIFRRCLSQEILDKTANHGTLCHTLCGAERGSEEFSDPRYLALILR